jgi:hypothetical protein
VLLLLTEPLPVPGTVIVIARIVLLVNFFCVNGRREKVSFYVIVPYSFGPSIFLKNREERRTTTRTRRISRFQHRIDIE